MFRCDSSASDSRERNRDGPRQAGSQRRSLSGRGSTAHRPTQHCTRAPATPPHRRERTDRPPAHMNVRTTTKRDSAGHVVLTAAHTTVRCPGLPHTTRSTPDCAHAMFWARFHSSTFVFSLLCTGPRCDRDACGVRRRVRCTHSEVRLTLSPHPPRPNSWIDGAGAGVINRRAPRQPLPPC